METAIPSVPRTMVVRCASCRKFGVMTRKEPLELCPEGRVLVQFFCRCGKGKVDFDNPY